jgi:hypothetical protein
MKLMEPMESSAALDALGGAGVPPARSAALLSASSLHALHDLHGESS